MQVDVAVASRGPTSFADVRTVNGIQYATYKETAIALGLCEHDAEWDHVLREATLFKVPAALCDLFVTIKEFNNPMDVTTLWHRYRDSLLEDFF